MFIPGAITGFFDIHPSMDIDSAGTTGFSVCISCGLRMQTIAVPSKAHRVRYYTQGKKSVIPVSEFVYSSFVPSMKRTYDITFLYYPYVQIGAGFGMSGATALGTAYSLSRLQPNANYGHMAYRADTFTKGGYGDVVSQLNGGALLRTTPGIDSKVCDIDPKGYRVLCAVFGPLSTKGILEDAALVEAINEEGSKCLRNAMSDPRIEKMMELSNKFSNEISIATPRLDEAIEAVSSVNRMPASMVMLGESLFTFVKDEDIPGILEVLTPYGGEILVSDIWRNKIGDT